MSPNERTQAFTPSLIALESTRISPLPWWLVGIVALGALLISAGALIALLHPAMLVSSQDPINGAVRVYAGYLVSRNLALAIMLFITLGIVHGNLCVPWYSSQPSSNCSTPDWTPWRDAGL
jgi:hypothetical protein